MSATPKALVLALAGLLTISPGAFASPSVSVGVRAPFAAPPYLISLLETAAEENATSYYSLLDRIADGYFDTATTDQQLYTSFRSLLQSDGHLTKEEDLSSFDLALSISAAAPRIQTHYQFYNTTIAPLLMKEQDQGCETWLHVPWEGKRFCSADLAETSAHLLGEAKSQIHRLPFDRELGDTMLKRPSILYADILSKSFRQFHKTLSQAARDGKSSYLLRYRPAATSQEPLLVSGYGVELALKRTDYIVIDDRQDSNEDQASPAAQTTLNEDEVADLRPLSQSELSRLGVKAASFVLASDSPFDTLVRLSQDFPKHSSAIAAVNVSETFLLEHRKNRALLLPSGYNAVWINGIQIMPRDLDVYALLEHLRRERKMITSTRDAGLSAPQAIDLLAHEAVAASQISTDVQRYDWRDEHEGGDVIIWLNDLEKDERYEQWPSSLTALLQRMYPGQLPAVRRDIHNLVVPVDFASPTDVSLVIETLQSFIKRKIPMRFGVAPVAANKASTDQAKLIYHLLDAYGINAVLQYLEASLVGEGRKFSSPVEKYFVQTAEQNEMREGFTLLNFDHLLASPDYIKRVNRASNYLARLGALTSPNPIFANGVAIPRTEDWLQLMSQQLSYDLQVVQRGVHTGTIPNETWVPSIWLEGASLRRNPIIVPEDDKSIRHVNILDLPDLEQLITLSANPETVEDELVHIILMCDIDSEEGFAQIMEAMVFHRQHENVEMAIVDTSKASDTPFIVDENFWQALGQVLAHPGLNVAAPETVSITTRLANYETVRTRVLSLLRSNSGSGVSATRHVLRELSSSVGLRDSQHAVILNGRIVGPFDSNTILELEDFEALLSYERKRRLIPAFRAIRGLGLEAKSATPLDFARISNLIARSQISEVPEGIFEEASNVRVGSFKAWESSSTAIEVGNIDTATFQIVASIDPASELAQRWIPILKVLSELDGAYTRLFLNPKERLDELPVKRFYRHVLNSKPVYNDQGAVQGQKAHFASLPADALLNVGMDVPPAWLVAPADSIHDLDNIKLSAVKSGRGIEATYELEHVLIEGHSREVGDDNAQAGSPPRGAQLVLGTESNPHVADTIIMANLGYFQFKANPGVYTLSMQAGRSQEIFNIASAGALGYEAHPNDEGTEIALMSFKGLTLFPRISRKAGMEEADVLEPAKSTLDSLAGSADKFLAKAGLPGTGAGKYLSQAAKFGSQLLSGTKQHTDLAEELHAEINIFSVASGHLYERMLNIMMVSVMKHTKHTVKFWFIEQFLSPSFKAFLPVLAAEYGFRYEMVTYKWPHWLRGQKEKQREIWGYKILFLDVLFPLDLDKVIFVDADQIVRTDMYELVQHDLEGAPYGFTPMCDSRVEMEGFRFWKQGYWKNFLHGLPYHISALYVVDLKKFRQIAAGDRLRQQYHQLSADPNSLSNLDQDLPNHMQMALPIHSLPQDWLWCETWCSDEALKTAKTIDLCNNPQTKEPKLDRARRQVPEWTVYDDEIAAVATRHRAEQAQGRPVSGDAADAGPQGTSEESIQERLQREDAERERKSSGHEEL